MGVSFWAACVGEINHGLRVLRKSPGFTAVAVLSLGLGMGANSAIFELVDALRLRVLPVSHPDALAQIRMRGGNRLMGLSEGPDYLTYPLFDEIRRHQQAFAGVFAWGSDTLRIGEGSRVHQAFAALVSGGYFEILGVHPVLGRLLGTGDDRAGCASPGVVLSYRFWQSEFGGDPAVIGRELNVVDLRLPVIGVAPASFTGLEVGRKMDFALPICAQGVLNLGYDSISRTDVYWLTVMGRLQPGWTIARASESLRAISPPLLEATLPVGYSAQNVTLYRRSSLEAIPGEAGISELRAQYDSSLNLLLAVTGLVLLIACANLANLMLARGSVQQREFAIRLALGASRIRLAVQCLAQSLLLALGGAALGLLLSRVIGGGLIWYLGNEADPVQLDLRPDVRLLIFSGAVALAACLLFGLAPAWRASQSQPGAAIQAGGRGLTAGRQHFWLQRSLVVIQIAVSLALIIGAVLFVRSFRNLVTLDPGFRVARLFQTIFTANRAALARTGPAPYRQPLLNEVRTIPGVEAASATTNFLIHDGIWSLIVAAGERRQDARFTWVTPGYFAIVAIPILAGRDFNDTDTANAPKVAVVNETFARRFFGNQSPVGRTFRTQPEPDYPATIYQVVGVIKDTRYYDLRDPVPALCYAPAAQYPPGGIWSQMYVRSALTREALTAALRRRLAAAHPGIAVDVRAFQQTIDDSLVRDRLLAILSGSFGTLAGMLAAIGLYGLLVYLTARRRNEIGIRMALGSSRQHIIFMVLKELTLLFAAGSALGLAAGAALERFAASLLFGMPTRDLRTYAAALTLMAGAALLGSFFPAHRASRLNPMDALRVE